MKIIFLFCLTASLFLIPSFKIYAQNTEQDSILHTQIITRGDLSISYGYAGVGGELLLTSNNVVFNTRNKKGKCSFKLNYDHIESVEKKWSLFTPNIIIIRDKNYAKFTLITYRRKKIVDIINSKI
ncbi:MAG: hypothetical protein JJU23_12755 [Cyclobacteriaceae bacterium]|nr:hypothetical protein [Cyclobacteriaceae bacterium]